MNNQTKIIITSIAIYMLSLPLQAQQNELTVIRGATLLPITSEPIENGIIVLKNGKIAAIGSDVSIPKGANITPAKLWGIDDNLGSLEKGKDADFVLYEGDPFEYTTKVTAVYIKGEKVSNGG